MEQSQHLLAILFAVLSLSSISLAVHPCDIDNGGCEDKCERTIPDKATCRCLKPAMFIGGDGKTCDNVESCPREKGSCVTASGAVQKMGVVKYNSINGNTMDAEETCLELCMANPKATGCELIWNQGNRGCYAHTQEIAKGNGDDRHNCWVFDKCIVQFIQVPEIIGCRSRCGGKGGYCPHVCGRNAMCCRKGHEDCPLDYQAMGELNKHMCMALTIPNSVMFVQVPNTSGCLEKCGGKGGYCPAVCGRHAMCCRSGHNDCPLEFVAVSPSDEHACIKIKIPTAD